MTLIRQTIAAALIALCGSAVAQPDSPPPPPESRQGPEKGPEHGPPRERRRMERQPQRHDERQVERQVERKLEVEFDQQSDRRPEREPSGRREDRPPMPIDAPPDQGGPRRDLALDRPEPQRLRDLPPEARQRILHWLRDMPPEARQFLRQRADDRGGARVRTGERFGEERKGERRGERRQEPDQDRGSAFGGRQVPGGESRRSPGARQPRADGARGFGGTREDQGRPQQSREPQFNGRQPPPTPPPPRDRRPGGRPQGRVEGPSEAEMQHFDDLFDSHEFWMSDDQDGAGERREPGFDGDSRPPHDPRPDERPRE